MFVPNEKSALLLGKLARDITMVGKIDGRQALLVYSATASEYSVWLILKCRRRDRKLVMALERRENW
jgi:hypothetical protein